MSVPWVKWDSSSANNFTEVLNSPAFKTKLLSIEEDPSGDSDKC